MVDVTVKSEFDGQYDAVVHDETAFFVNQIRKRDKTRESPVRHFGGECVLTWAPIRLFWKVLVHYTCHINHIIKE